MNERMLCKALIWANDCSDRGDHVQCIVDHSKSVDEWNAYREHRNAAGLVAWQLAVLVPVTLLSNRLFLIYARRWRHLHRPRVDLNYRTRSAMVLPRQSTATRSENCRKIDAFTVFSTWFGISLSLVWFTNVCCYSRHISYLCPLTGGVPQGFILGSILPILLRYSLFSSALLPSHIYDMVMADNFSSLSFHKSCHLPSLICSLPFLSFHFGCHLIT